MATTKKIFQKYISEKFPKKQTNIFWQLFNGIDAIFDYLELYINIYKRERNFLTATTLISLRNLSSQNGFEPTLKVPSKGIIELKISPKLFNKVGYPLYLPPYSVFKNKTNKLNYYYNSNKTLKIENGSIFIPIVEGELVTKTYVSNGNFIERFYIDNDSIADKSLSININNENYKEVKSFFDNDGLYNNKQFITKFSNKQNTPLVIYVKGTNQNDIVNVTYRLTSGEFGNIENKHNFETQSIINSNGDIIEISDDEIEINNISGFNFGSNGTDINSLKSAIGFNHGSNLLFDTVSYTEYINKFSNILLQKILLNPDKKSINNIFVSKRQYINNNESSLVSQQYIKIIDSKSYLLSDSDIINLNELISENEFALSSHNLYSSDINKFGLQILFNTKYEQEKNEFELTNLIYKSFGNFFYDKYFILNLELLFNDFMKLNNTFFEYTIFNENIEKSKIINLKELSTPYIIKHENELPILRGDFNIADLNFSPIKLFSDINIVSKETL